MERNPNTTAESVAMIRAAHYILDAEPKLLNDPFARALAGFASDEDLLVAFRKRPQALQESRPLFAIRTRYAEDELAKAIARGTAQYIILGAGLDSFAYRCARQYPSLAVFEVDHPAAQKFKRQRVAELGFQDPPRLRYVPVDFETQELKHQLIQSGVQTQEPSFTSCLGVTQYLTHKAVISLLRDIRALGARGSDLVLQFQVPTETLDEKSAAVLTALATAAAAHGEPFLSFFTPREMEQHLLDAGFTGIEHFGVKEAKARYLLGRSDNLHLPAHFQMIKAHLA